MPLYVNGIYATAGELFVNSTPTGDLTTHSACVDQLYVCLKGVHNRRTNTEKLGFVLLGPLLDNPNYLSGS